MGTSMSKSTTTDTDNKCLVVSVIIRVSVNNISAYAISIYYTKCSFLVNGKNVNKFIEEDLPNITSVAKDVLLNGNKVNLQALNTLLEEQLQKLYDDRNKLSTTNFQKSSNSHQIALKKASNNTDTKCIKCNRNVQTRGVSCSKTEHWIHYYCGKLTEKDISDIEANSDDPYNCIMCINDNLVTTCEPTKTNMSESRQILATPTLQHNAMCQSQNRSLSNSPCENLARSLLAEEFELACSIGDSNISDNIVYCETCSLPCHYSCMNSENNCSKCLAMNTQCENTNSTTDKIQPSDETHLDNQVIVPTVSEKTNDIRNEQTSRTNYDNPISSSTISVHDNNSSIPETTSIPNTTKELKQSELRQREQKIRKREDELKIRERIIEESQNERTWFKTYINKLEQRVKELARSN